MKGFERRALEAALDCDDSYSETTTELLARHLASYLVSRAEGMGCLAGQVTFPEDSPDTSASFDVKVGPSWFRVRISGCGPAHPVEAAAPELAWHLRRLCDAIERMDANPCDGLADEARERLKRRDSEES